jgi:hypothetical protein
MAQEQASKDPKPVPMIARLHACLAYSKMTMREWCGIRKLDPANVFRNLRGEKKRTKEWVFGEYFVGVVEKHVWGKNMYEV